MDFGALYSRYAQGVFRFALSLLPGNRELAGDIAAETFARALTVGDNIRPGSVKASCPTPPGFGGARPGEAPPVFVAVGRFVEKKAPQLTVEAFAEVVRSRPDARLRMIGDGPLLDDCRKLAADLGIDGAVTFLGTQPPEVVAGGDAQSAHLRAAFRREQKTAIAGRYARVGILEGRARSRPAGSWPHTIAGLPGRRHVPGETGFLVAEKDVATMATHMLALAESPGARRPPCGRQARRADRRALFQRAQPQSSVVDYRSGATLGARSDCQPGAALRRLSSVALSTCRAPSSSSTAASGQAPGSRPRISSMRSRNVSAQAVQSEALAR